MVTLSPALPTLKTTASLRRPSAPPNVPREFRAVWIATVDNIDWPSRGDTHPATQRAELIRLLDQACSLRLNTVIFQVRPAADAIYKSRYEPWSVYVTGKQGQAPSPEYDPLAFAVHEAHLRGLQIEAWFNPYRAQLLSSKSPLDPSHIARTNPELVKKYGDLLWMDPGEPQVQRRSLDVIEDVVRRYDIDGVHLDDYFYPYPDGDQDFPDSSSFARYGHGLTKAQWRHENVDNFIEKLSEGIHKIKPEIMFGISPFGIYRPGVPSGIKAGVDQYSQLYSDPVKWLQKGWCDYLSPQLYWPINQKEQSFSALLTWWRSQNLLGRHIWPGLYTSRVLSKRKGYEATEIANQIRICRQGSSDPGHIHFSMSAFKQDGRGINECLLGQCYQESALPPASPWLNPTPPNRPQVSCDRTGMVSWTRTQGEIPFWYVLWQRHGSQWSYQILPGDTSVDHVPPRLASGKLEEVRLVAVSRTGIGSPSSQAFPQADPSSR